MDMTRKQKDKDRLNRFLLVSAVSKTAKVKFSWVEDILYYYYQALAEFLYQDDHVDRKVKVHGWGEFYFSHNASTAFKGDNHNFKISGIVFRSYPTSTKNLIKARETDPDWQHHFYKERSNRFKRTRIQHSQHIKSLPDFNAVCWKHDDMVRYICNKSHIIVEVVEYVLRAFKQVIFNFFLSDLDSRTKKRLVLENIGSVTWCQTEKKSRNQNGLLKEHIELVPAYRYGKEVKQFTESQTA